MFSVIKMRVVLVRRSRLILLLVVCAILALVVFNLHSPANSLRSGAQSLIKVRMFN